MRYLGCLLTLFFTLTAYAQNPVAPTFFNADFRTLPAVPGTDGNGKPAHLNGIRLWDDGVKWAQVNPSQTAYNWKLLDEFVTAALADGKDVLYTFGATPQWAAQGAQPKGCNNPGPWSCAVPVQGYIDAFVTTLVTRYKGRIAYYELWNEPDCSCFFTGSSLQLAAMTNRMYGLIKAADSAAVVLSPSFHGPTMATKFDAWFMAGGTFDVLNVHMRDKPNAAPENFVTVYGQVLTEVQKRGLTQPWWDDEHGVLNTDGITDAGMLATYAARELLMRAGYANTPHPIVRQYVYQWDAPAPYNLQNAAAGSAWNTVSSWLAGQVTTPCKATGQVWACGVGKKLVVWNAAQTCKGVVCTYQPYTYPKGYTTTTTLQSVTSKLMGGTLALGVSPQLLQ